jgi:hypothetical protein
MRNAIHRVSQWSALGLAGLIVQDWFHGLDLGRWIIPVSTLLVLACVAFVVTWPPFLRGTARLLLEEMKAIEPTIGSGSPAPQLLAPPAQPAATVNEQRERVLRANIQLLMDEMAEIVRALAETIKRGSTTLEMKPKRDKWENIKDSLRGEPNTHVPYRLTRDAYQHLERVHVGEYDFDEGMSITEAEAAELHDEMRAVSREFDYADRTWLNYLNDLDQQAYARQ